MLVHGLVGVQASFHVVGGSAQGGVNHAWFAKITGCWVEDSWGRASPSGRLFQWSSGDVIVFGAWVEAEEMERSRGVWGWKGWHC